MISSACYGLHHGGEYPTHPAVVITSDPTSDRLRGSLRRLGKTSGTRRRRSHVPVRSLDHSPAPTHEAAARLSEDGLDLVEDPEELGVLDDSVDELIEAALDRGVEVVTVPDGALARHGRLVLALRGPVPALVP